MKKDRRKLSHLNENDLDARLGTSLNVSPAECTTEYLRRTIIKLNQTNQNQTKWMIVLTAAIAVLTLAIAVLTVLLLGS